MYNQLLLLLFRRPLFQCSIPLIFEMPIVLVSLRQTLCLPTASVVFSPLTHYNLRIVVQQSKRNLRPIWISAHPATTFVARVFHFRIDIFFFYASPRTIISIDRSIWLQFSRTYSRHPSTCTHFTSWRGRRCRVMYVWVRERAIPIIWCDLLHFIYW